MGVLDSVLHGMQAKPRRTVIFGVHGGGKSTWASKWDKPLFIPTEDGNADIDCDSLPLFTDFDSVYSAVMELAHDQLDSPYKTYILDSADWLERLAQQKAAREMNVKSVGEVDWGKGFARATEYFDMILRGLQGLRNSGRHVVITAHCEIKRFDDPNGDSYDRYLPKLHKSANAILQEWADEVLFLSYKTMTRTTEGKRKVGVGTGERVIKTCERPGWQAKNRLGLPEEISADFEEYKQYLPPIA